MPPREVEIFERLDEIDCEMKKLLAESVGLHLELKTISEQKISETFHKEQLIFEGNSHVVRWNSGYCVLPPKQFLILYFVWNGKNHEADFDDFEPKIWKQALVSSNNVKKQIHGLRKCLKIANCPVILKNLKNPQSRQSKGLKAVYYQKR